MTITNDDLFYCYSKQLSLFIWEHYKITPLTVALNPRSKRKFSLYVKTDKLQKALKHYDNEYYKN